MATGAQAGIESNPSTQPTGKITPREYFLLLLTIASQSAQIIRATPVDPLVGWCLIAFSVVAGLVALHVLNPPDLFRRLLGLAVFILSLVYYGRALNHFM